MVLYWVGLTYGHLRMGHRIFTSSCDFLFLHDSCPTYWRAVLRAYGNMRGLAPAVRIENELIDSRNRDNHVRDTWTWA